MDIDGKWYGKSAGRLAFKHIGCIKQFMFRHPDIPPRKRREKKCMSTYTNLSQLLRIPLPNLPLPNGRLSFLITFAISATGILACTIILVIFEFSTAVPASTIIFESLSSISDTDIPNLILNFRPPLTTGRDRADLAQGPVRHARDDKTSKEIDVVDVLGKLRHRLTNGSEEPDDIDEEAADIGCVSTPVETVGEIVGSRFLGGVKASDLVEAAADDVVVADDNAGDGGEEDGVGG